MIDRVFEGRGPRGVLPVGASLVGLLAVGLLCCAPRPVSAQSCPTSGEATVRIATIEPRLELRLADGRLVRLVGLDPPLQTPGDPDLGETARTQFAGILRGKDLTLHVLADRPDRWGRLSAFAFVPNGETPGRAGGLAAAAIAAGLGRVLAEPDATSCHDWLVAAETKARLAKLGLWHDPYYAVLAVDDRAGFAERAGTNVLAEGRLTAVQPGLYRTTLRFAAPKQDPSGSNRSGQGSFGGHMLVATIMPHAMKTFEARHVNLAELIGKQLLFRGLLDLRFGPRIELASPDQVEPIAAPVEPAAPPHSD